MVDLVVDSGPRRMRLTEDEFTELGGLPVVSCGTIFLIRPLMLGFGSRSDRHSRVIENTSFFVGKNIVFYTRTVVLAAAGRRSCNNKATRYFRTNVVFVQLRLIY